MSFDFILGLVIGFLLAAYLFFEPLRNKVNEYLREKKKPEQKTKRKVS